MNAREPIPPIDEPAFIKSFRQGDRPAFKLLHESITSHLLDVVLHTVTNPEEAEEIVAECLYRIYHKRDEMQSYEEIRRWLFDLAHNLSITRAKSAYSKNKESKSSLP